VKDYEPEEGKSKLEKDGGTFAFQAHDPGSTTMYKNIRVKELKQGGFSAAMSACMLSAMVVNPYDMSCRWWSCRKTKDGKLAVLGVHPAAMKILAAIPPGEGA